MDFRDSKGSENTPGAGERGTPLLKATILVLVVVLGATAAHAADACYQGAFGNILVSKKFKMPRPGDCSPITGYEHNSDCTLDGTACGTSDGTLVHFNFNFISHFSGFGTYFFVTDRSQNQGDGQFCQENLATGQFSCPTFITSKVNCPPDRSFLF